MTSFILTIVISAIAGAACGYLFARYVWQERLLEMEEMRQELRRKRLEIHRDQFQHSTSRLHRPAENESEATGALRDELEQLRLDLVLLKEDHRLEKQMLEEEAKQLRKGLDSTTVLKDVEETEVEIIEDEPASFEPSGSVNYIDQADIDEVIVAPLVPGPQAENVRNENSETERAKGTSSSPAPADHTPTHSEVQPEERESVSDSESPQNDLQKPGLEPTLPEIASLAYPGGLDQTDRGEAVGNQPREDVPDSISRSTRDSIIPSVPSDIESLFGGSSDPEMQSRPDFVSPSNLMEKKTPAEAEMPPGSETPAKTETTVEPETPAKTEKPAELEKPTKAARPAEAIESSLEGEPSFEPEPESIAASQPVQEKAPEPFSEHKPEPPPASMAEPGPELWPDSLTEAEIEGSKDLDVPPASETEEAHIPEVPQDPEATPASGKEEAPFSIHWQADRPLRRNKPASTKPATEKTDINPEVPVFRSLHDVLKGSGVVLPQAKEELAPLKASASPKKEHSESMARTSDESLVKRIVGLDADSFSLLSELGYANLKRLANLSSSEIRRLAAVFRIQPERIEQDWKPTAAAHLNMMSSTRS